MELEHKLQECQSSEQQLELTKSNLQLCLEHITKEKEEKKKEAFSWFNALQVVQHRFKLYVGYSVHPVFFK